MFVFKKDGMSVTKRVRNTSWVDNFFLKHARNEALPIKNLMSLNFFIVY